jgi:Sulfatase
MPGVLRKWRWQDLSFMSSIVTFGLSQIFVNLLLAKPEAFSKSPLVAFWTIVFIQIIPLLVLFFIDRLWPEAKLNSLSYRIWRSALCSILCLSLLHQFRTFHSEYFHQFFSSLSIPLIYVIVGIFGFLVAFLSRKIVPLYLSYLGILGVSVSTILGWHCISGFKVEDHSRSKVVNNKSKIPVFLLIFDELQYDVLLKNEKISEKDFPNFAALAADSTWFTNATTNHWSTIESIPSILSGRVIPSNNDLTLFEYLAPSHSSTLMLTEMEVESRLRREARSVNHYRGKSYLLGYNPLYAAEFAYIRLINFFRFKNPKNSIIDDTAYHVSLFGEIDELLAEPISKSVPLIVCHLSIPHSPFIYDRIGRMQTQSGSYFPFAEDYDPSEYDFIYDHYLEQVRFADHILGRIIDHLKRVGFYNSSLLIVTSDHGLRIWGDPYRNADAIARIPLMIRMPGTRPSIYKEDFQLIDLLPTILDVLRLPYEKAKLDGVSFFSSKRPARDKIVHFYPSPMAYNYSKSVWFSTKKASKGSESKLNARLASNFQHAAVSDEFSATALMDDVFMSRDGGKDFLKLYLHKHFPRSITAADLEKIKSNIALLEHSPDSSNINFRRGVQSFFLALGQTYLISKNQSFDVKQINQNWQESLQFFEKSMDLSSPIHEQVSKLLKTSDTDQDGNLNEEELKAMIKSRGI